MERHIEHARQLLAVLPEEGLAVDLGSGGGAPALPLACALPGLRWLLIESQLRRADWLRLAVIQLGLGGRVDVIAERAEVVGHSAVRGTGAVVTARSFGPPAVTAECAAPLLGEGGQLWVAEPPDLGAPVTDRWPHNGPPMVGMVVVGRQGSWMGLRRQGPVAEKYPRRPGIPVKRPLF